MLSSQDALALISTSASQRQIGAFLGVSHQKIGRWLKGQGSMPSDLYPALRDLARLHSEVSQQQAAIDGIPFSREYPVFAYRPRVVPEPDGRMQPPNARMFIDNTQYIRDELRKLVFYSMYATDDFSKASVASVIDWLRYVQSRQMSGSMYSQNLMPGMNDAEKTWLLERTNVIKPIWTKASETYSGVLGISNYNFNLFYDTIKQRLQERHEPNAVELSNRYVFQIKSEQRRNEEKRGRKIVAAKKASNRKKQPARKKRGK